MSMFPKNGSLEKVQAPENEQAHMLIFWVRELLFPTVWRERESVSSYIQRNISDKIIDIDFTNTLTKSLEWLDVRLWLLFLLQSLFTVGFFWVFFLQHKWCFSQQSCGHSYEKTATRFMMHFLLTFVSVYIVHF